MKGKQLQIAPFCHRYAALAADNDMIQRLGANHVERVLERCGQGAISLAGFGIPRGMVMHQYYGGGVVFKGDLDHFPWIHAGSIQGASKQLPETNHPVFAVEQ